MNLKNRLCLLVVAVMIPIVGYAQIANYNHFPTLKPSHILDEKLIDISFAFSMRVLESDYNGPLVRLRRGSDNTERDFGWGDNDIVDVVAIDTWRNGAQVFVHTWYDQSGLGQDAVQATTWRQPRFYPDATMPYFRGDGSNDHLTVDTPNGLQDVTNNGSEGSVLMVMRVTKKNQYNFGVGGGLNRWSAHVNWSNNNAYFDPGYCCNNPRSFNNAANENVWAQYTFVKTNTNIIMRTDAADKVNAAYTKARCTLTTDFAIGWATDGNSYSTSSFTEFIMYKTDIPGIEYEEIEKNTITFWGL